MEEDFVNCYMYIKECDFDILLEEDIIGKRKKKLVEINIPIGLYNSYMELEDAVLTAQEKLMELKVELVNYVKSNPIMVYDEYE